MHEAFDRLDTLGFSTSRGEACCATCALSTLAVPFAYWHRKNEGDHQRSETYLGWSGDPVVIMAELGQAGLTVEWHGDPATRLLARLPAADQPLP